MPGLLDIFALTWFISLWIGYTLFAKRRAKVQSCLSYELRRKRTDWMRKMLSRENNMPDVGLISTLERNVAFFASSCLLIMAGLLTAMSSAEQVSSMLTKLLPWSTATGTGVQLKILFLTFIYVFGFFQFTWSLRQYGFSGVLVGAAPDGRSMTDEEKELFANRAAKVLDQAGHSFNYGLRAIYFSLAALSWFIHPLLLVFASVVVVVVLKQREFHSAVLKALRLC